MLRKYKPFITNLSIHPRFSKREVVNKLEHLLPMHLTCEYTHNPTNCLFAKRVLKKALRKFCRENSQFGRIILTSRRSINRNIPPPPQYVNDTEEVSELQNHQFYTSLNLLSESIPNYTSVDDIIVHITENLESTRNNSDEEYNDEPYSDEDELPLATALYTFQDMQANHEAIEENEHTPLIVGNPPHLSIEGYGITNSYDVENGNLYGEDSENNDTRAVNIYLDAIINDFGDSYEDDDYDEIEFSDED